MNGQGRRAVIRVVPPRADKDVVCVAVRSETAVPDRQVCTGTDLQALDVVVVRRRDVGIHEVVEPDAIESHIRRRIAETARNHGVGRDGHRRVDLAADHAHVACPRDVDPVRGRDVQELHVDAVDVITVRRQAADLDVIRAERQPGELDGRAGLRLDLRPDKVVRLRHACHCLRPIVARGEKHAAASGRESLVGAVDRQAGRGLGAEIFVRSGRGHVRRTATRSRGARS